MAQATVSIVPTLEMNNVRRIDMINYSKYYYPTGV